MSRSDPSEPPLVHKLSAEQQPDIGLYAQLQAELFRSGGRQSLIVRILGGVTSSRREPWLILLELFDLCREIVCAGAVEHSRSGTFRSWPQLTVFFMATFSLVEASKGDAVPPAVRASGTIPWLPPITQVPPLTSCTLAHHSQD
eukprot:915698-Amphidinium_carterae.1